MKRIDLIQDMINNKDVKGLQEEVERLHEIIHEAEGKCEKYVIEQEIERIKRVIKTII